MKKIGLFILLVGLMLLPFSVNAASKKYKPNSDAITIYLFRGKGCGYCRAFLTFLDNISGEYGKYFKLQAYEVWNDQENATLLNEVSEHMGEAAGGVPYIVIGDKVFAGYAEQYDNDIKEAITTLYKTKKDKRYDVFADMKKDVKNYTTLDLLGALKEEGLNTASTSGSSLADNQVIVWTFIFVLVSTFVIMTFVSLKFKELHQAIDGLKPELKDTNKETKKDKKK